MVQSSLLLALCLLGAATGEPSSHSVHLLTPRNIIPKSRQVKNYPGQCSANDQATTKTCLDAYFSTYGIDSSKGLPAFFDYVAKTNSVVEQYGVAGFDIYCDFETTLESCLGGLLTSPCMNPAGFMKMYGLDEIEALNYATSYPVEAYTCENKDLVKSYFSCMMDINQDQFQGLVDCTTAAQKEFQNATDTCVPIDHYVTCIEDYYVKFCDEGIRSYVCNTQEIAFNFDSMCTGKLHQC